MFDPIAQRVFGLAAAAVVKPKIPNTNLVQPRPKPNFDNSDIGYPYPPKIWEKGYVATPWYPT